MSDEGAVAPAPQGDLRWWNKGEWQLIPSGILSAETSNLAAAINDAEYPDLSALIRYGDDVDGYLRMLGISENSISGREDSSAMPEDEEPMGMGE